MSKRILIVEDNALIAMTLAQDLEDAGFLIAGPCRTVAQSLQKLKQNDIDAAVLDMDLGGETSAEVARALNQANKPFIVVSGYLDATLNEPFIDAPSFGKPYLTQDLVVRLKALFAPRTAQDVQSLVTPTR
jgi:DNA-binding response OmpR family regulator